MFSFPGMEKLFLIGTGGFIGACLRYMVSSQVSRIKNISAGTLTVNLLGTIVLAFLTFSSEPKSMVYLVNIGILGSFSTFSTFAYKTFKLLEEGQNFSFFLNIFLNVTLCLGVSIAFLAPSFEFNTESWVKTFSGKYCSRNYSSINKIFLNIYSKIQKAKSQSKF